MDIDDGPAGGRALVDLRTSAVMSIRVGQRSGPVDQARNNTAAGSSGASPSSDESGA